MINKGGEDMNTDALVNAILSFIFPGLGQAINGYKKKGIIMFIIFIILIIVLFFFFFGLIANIILFIYQIYAAYDAYVTY